MNGVALMLLSSACFTLNDAALKLALTWLPYGQAVAIRGISSCALLFVFVIFKAGPRAVLWSNAAGQIESTCWFVLTSFLFVYSLPYLDFAVAITALYTAPLFSVVLAWFFLGERVSCSKVAAAVVGFVGVALTAGFTAQIEWAILSPIGAALCTALRDIKLTKLLRSENSLSILTSHQVGLTLFGIGFAILEPSPAFAPPSISYWIAAVASLGGVLGVHFTLASLRVAEVSTVAACRYSAVLWAALVGYLVWNKSIDFSQVIGMGLVITSGIVIAVESHLASRRGSSQSVNG